jgi:hypothetical protein
VKARILGVTTHQPHHSSILDILEGLRQTCARLHAGYPHESPHPPSDLDAQVVVLRIDVLYSLMVG